MRQCQIFIGGKKKYKHAPANFFDGTAWKDEMPRPDDLDAAMQLHTFLEGKELPDAALLVKVRAIVVDFEDTAGPPGSRAGSAVDLFAHGAFEGSQGVSSQRVCPR